ncbi:MAG: hypothetical protein R3B97_03735 [Dehalococcoidia bacterium]|nr:hypothetical protein [Dehalococcoidia bacterium]MCB9485571.1 hypothetical protein [Thermoflexaceae bacterium]
MRRAHALGWILAASLVLASGIACNNEKKNPDTGTGDSGVQEQAPQGGTPRADF